MESAKVTDIQRSIFGILQNFDDFCRKKEISYFIIGGTLLGAVRHGGFIPWDDDIDIGVPRQDYDRLVSMAVDIKLPYVMENHDINPENYFPFVKIYNADTVALEDVVSPLRRGVWIDIFPIDGTFDSRIFVHIQMKIIGLLKRLIAYRAGGYSLRNKSKSQTHFLQILSSILRFFPARIYYSALDHIVRWRDFEGSRNVGNLFGYWGIGEIVSKDLFKKPTPITFETMETFGPSNPDAYLKSVYGDYMKLPPLEKRYGHKFKEIDLNASSSETQLI